ncbi:hypothetical protein CPC08DRAFT_259996 [Agrocybe pediades]|nr:hypothetical protein CPC08DRAFT_259996 [Agrocybe pediades]
MAVLSIGLAHSLVICQHMSAVLSIYHLLYAVSSTFCDFAPRHALSYPRYRNSTAQSVDLTPHAEDNGFSTQFRRQRYQHRREEAKAVDCAHNTPDCVFLDSLQSTVPSKPTSTLSTSGAVTSPVPYTNGTLGPEDGGEENPAVNDAWAQTYVHIHEDIIASEKTRQRLRKQAQD